MGRRFNGEGSVYKRNDSRRAKKWVAQKTLPDGRRKYSYARTKQEAIELLKTMQAQVREGALPPSSERLTVKQYFTEWLAMKERQLKPSSLRTYRERVENVILPNIGHRQLSKLHPLELEKLYRQQLEKGDSPATVQMLHRIIHRALGDAVRLGYLPANIAKNLAPPRGARSRAERAMLPEEARRLLQAARGDSLEALVVLALTTGMRKGELLALRWRDIDLDNGLLQVSGTLVRIAGDYRIEPPKSASGRRRIPLPQEAVDALRAHRQRQLEERLRAGPAWRELDLVFCRADGYYLNERSVLRWYHELLERAGLPRYRFHDLRHTAATVALANGVSLRETSALLGHSRPSMTLDTYAHAVPGADEKAVRRIAQALMS
ncbi:tyrosine-type recombinase/integrase [Tepidiforma thermophila]|uniref:Integrase n=1 Tax=Tepidiforma thermophila (strain KCTC 52669 / CGMCC 1.13589 / G233) TaxID=2761530 RepID=A0A2A9HGJ4_TEPT2|nr:site-specific integrase [Tepidiforma thermophila]PFG75147.1 integrase [Tepidiforma thermophila]